MRLKFLATIALAMLASLPGRADAVDLHDPKIDGAVFFSLPKNAPGDSFVLQAVGNGARTQFSPGLLTKDGPIGAHGWMRAGDYRLVAWNGAVLNDMPKITIEAGRLTDAGALMAFPVGDRKFVLLPIRLEETAHDIDTVLPQYAPELTSTDTLRWQVAAPSEPTNLPAAESPLGGLIPALLASYEAHLNKATVHKRLLDARTVDGFYNVVKETVPPLTTVAAVDPDGRALYGADFGQIRTRASNGEWGAIDTGTLQAVTVVASAASRMMAGYDDGSIRASDDRGTTWKLVSAAEPGWRVTGLEHVGERWVALAAHLLPSKVNPRFPPLADRARISETADIGPPAFVASLEFLYDDPQWVMPHSEHDGTNLYVNVFPTVWRLDVKTAEWKSLRLPSEVADFHLGGSNVVVAWRAQGMFSKVYVSSDQGEAWKKIDHPSLQIADIRMFDVGHGAAIRSHNGAFTVSQEIYDYDAAHDEWRLVSEAPQGCVRVLVDTDHRPRLCVTSGATILGWADGKWAMEYSTE